jgi:hypothetical protein
LSLYSAIEEELHVGNRDLGHSRVRVTFQVVERLVEA